MSTSPADFVDNYENEKFIRINEALLFFQSRPMLASGVLAIIGPSCPPSRAGPLLRTLPQRRSE